MDVTNRPSPTVPAKIPTPAYKSSIDAVVATFSSMIPLTVRTSSSLPCGDA